MWEMSENDLQRLKSRLVELYYDNLFKVSHLFRNILYLLSAI